MIANGKKKESYKEAQNHEEENCAKEETLEKMNKGWAYGEYIFYG